MRSILQQSIAVGLLCAAAVAGAKDLGVQGNVWPIVEPDIRQLLVENAAKVDWSKTQQKLKESAETYLDRLPKRRLPVAEVTRTDYMDPSIVLTSDIQAPVKQADGKYRWQVLFPKGMKVNPLHSQRPVTAFLMFDGSDEEQRELVKNVLALEKMRIVPVEAGAGDIAKTNEYLGRPVFHASDAMLARFNVTYLPALVYPGTGAYSDYIAVTSYARPFKAEPVLLTWSDIAFRAPAAKGPSK